MNGSASPDAKRVFLDKDPNAPSTFVLDQQKIVKKKGVVRAPILFDPMREKCAIIPGAKKRFIRVPRVLREV